MTVIDETAHARELLLGVLQEQQRPSALELLKAAQVKDQQLTLGFLQTALVQLIAEKQVRVDEQLRIDVPAA